MFGAGGQLLGSVETQAGVSGKVDQAMKDLALKAERQRKEKIIEEREQEKSRQEEEQEKENIRRINTIHNLHYAATVKPESVDLDAAELEDLREIRKRLLKAEKKELEANIAKGHGELSEVVQDDFLNTVLKSKFCVVHFYHPDFEKCKLMDKLLAKLAVKHKETRVCKLNAEKAPFFVDRLGIRVLPSVVCFIDGKKIDNVVGFDFDLVGGNDQGEVEPAHSASSAEKRKLRELEERLGLSGVIKMEKSFYLPEKAPGTETSITEKHRSKDVLEDTDGVDTASEESDDGDW